MMIYNETNLYIFQLVYIHFMSSFVKWMTCRWNVENDMIMYPTAFDNWYMNMVFYVKLLHDNSKYQNICNINVT